MATTPDPEVTEPAPVDIDDETTAPTPPRRRRRGLRAGPDAETDFTIVHIGDGHGDRVVQRLAIPDPRPRRR